MMDNPNLIRNVALAGHLHHGKVRSVHAVPPPIAARPRSWTC